MRRTTLFEGHYRAIEKDFRELVPKLLPGRGQLWVIAAGAEQLDRLREIFLDVTSGTVSAGIRFLPGIRHLAGKMQPLPAPLETVSHSDRTLFALRAMEVLKKGEPFHQLRDNHETAHSLGTFFEDLFEHGINPELYRVTSLSLSRDQTATERAAGSLLTAYGALREDHYTSCVDMMMERDIRAAGSDTFIFYGFYDLNPLQRRFLKRILRDSGDVYWFSPVTENSRWESVYRRTRKLLDDLGSGSAGRSDRDIPMNEFGSFLEFLGTGGAASRPPAGFRVTAAAGEMGACRAALDRISGLRAEGVPLRRIAVARRKGEGDSLVRMAFHEGVPVNSPLTSRLARMPQARFILDLLKFMCGEFYHVYLETVLSWGMFREEFQADPSQVAGVSSDQGIRIGIQRWRDWYASDEGEGELGRLLRKVDEFHGSLPERAAPAVFLERLREFLEEVTVLETESALGWSLFDTSKFRSVYGSTLESFSVALRLQYQSVEVLLREADIDGFQVLTVEKLRGSSFRSVILMDMEEGVFPRPQVEDPRLSEELRGKLQLALKSQREAEDALLLRQAGEAAEETLDIIYREQAGDGSEISPSPFIASLVIPSSGAVPDPRWFVRESSSPVRQLVGGGHPGQRTAVGALEGTVPDDPVFRSALRAERSRMDFSSFDRYDGILDRSPVEFHRWSPTLLEQYARCPFAFLAGKCWKLERREPVDIGCTPDAATRGNVIHDSVERIVELHGFIPPAEAVIRIVEETAEVHGLAKVLGADYLCRMFVDRESEAIRRSLTAMQPRGWSFVASEVHLTGTLGDIEIGGRVDLLLEDPASRLVLLDLKSGSLPKGSDIEKGYLFQLPFYYQLALQNYPDRITGSMAYASISQRTPGKLSEWSAGKMASIMDRVRENAETIVGMIRGGLFPPAPTVRCDGCPYRGLCRLTPTDRIRAKVQSDGRMDYFRERLSLR